MSTYIGARYVPKFMGTYDPTQSYENMVVVDNGLGTSYISKVPVPANTPLTNTDYWAIYGASSGAIINLQNQIGDLTSLTTSDQSNLVSAINEVDSDVQTLLPLVGAYVTPEFYGAIGDGLTDDSDAIEAAINSGLPVVFAHTTYVCNRKLSFSNIDSIILIGNDCTIITQSEIATSNLITAASVDNIIIKDINIVTTADQADASVYNRDPGNNYSNVTFVMADDFDKFVLDNVHITNLEGLAKVQDNANNDAVMVSINNCIGDNCNYFIYGAKAEYISINNCLANHAHSSRLDHTLYLSNAIDNLTIDNIISNNCVGAAIHVFAASATIETSANNYTISNCMVNNGFWGGIYVMGGKGVIDNCDVKCRNTIGTGAFAIRNQGSKLSVNDCKLESTYLLLSDLSNINQVQPDTTFNNCDVSCRVIEGFNDQNAIGGTRIINNCNILCDTGTSPYGLIFCDTTDAIYKIMYSHIKRYSGNPVALIKSTVQCTAKILFNTLERYMSLYDGDDANVIGLANVCYATCATPTGTYSGNTTGYTGTGTP